MAIKPLADRVLVKPLVSNEKTPGGIYLPDTAKEKPQEGTVIAVGPGKTTDDGKKNSTGSKSRRSCFVWKIFWYRSND